MAACLICLACRLICREGDILLGQDVPEDHPADGRYYVQDIVVQKGSRLDYRMYLINFAVH